MSLIVKNEKKREVENIQPGECYYCGAAADEPCDKWCESWSNPVPDDDISVEQDNLAAEDTDARTEMADIEATDQEHGK